MKPLVLSGARTIVNINGEQFLAGYVLDYNLVTACEPINTLDNVFTDELAPQRVDVSMTMRVFRTPDNDPVELGYAPDGQSTKGATNQTNFLSTKYISIEVRDKVTDKTILFIPRAWIVSRSGSVSAEDLLSETWQIKGIVYSGTMV